MKKTTKFMIATLTAFACASGVTACKNVEKNITVIARTSGSGTRSAFDELVNDGNGVYLAGKDANGNKYSNLTVTASQLGDTGAVRSSVASDKNAIGYISLGSVDDSIKVVTIDGVAPTTATVLDGSYKIQRPFVIMTNKAAQRTAIAEDFIKYLYSSEVKTFVEQEGCIFLEDPVKRANQGAKPIAVGNWERQSALPEGGKISINGSTSMEKLITSAMAGYAAEYDVATTDIFTIDLQGSSTGKKAVEEDSVGNVIGLSSVAQNSDKIDCLNICLDAVAVIVNKQNERINTLTMVQLYDIYSGKVTKFSELQ